MSKFKLTEAMRRRIVGGAGMPKLPARVKVPASARYAAFPAFCERMGLPVPVAEFRFHAVRKWRFDFAWPEHRVYLEINGGVWSGGRHSRGAGMLKDWEKKNTASGMGWRPIECQPRDLMTTATVVAIRAALNYGLPTAGGPTLPSLPTAGGPT
jgi:hypothetical protein